MFLPTKKHILLLTLGFICTYIGLCFCLYFFQEDILYSPQPLSQENKQLMGKDFEKSTIYTPDKEVIK